MTTTSPEPAAPMVLPPDWRENPAVALTVLDVLRAAKREKLRGENKLPTFASPGALAAALDPLTVQTPALELIDQALVGVAEGRITRLIISMPPQEGKSERTTHYGALWLLHRNPNTRIAIISYADDIAARFSYAIRNDITVHNGDDGNTDLGMLLQRDSKAASEWRLQYPDRGGVIARGIGSSLTGRPVDAMFIDDPVKDMRSADSEKQSTDAWDWWQTVARTRLRPDAPVVLILTRWSENDLAGRLLAKQKQDEEAGMPYYDKWTVINIPAKADHDPSKGETDPLGREPGEYLSGRHSARGRTDATWQATEVATASRNWTALYQGRPSPDAGGVLKRDWFRRYTTPLWSTTVLPDGTITYRIADVTEVFQSWDLAFKDEKSSDYVVGQVWARRGIDVFLVEQIRERLDFTDSLATILATRARWPQTAAMLIEDKANGPAVINTLRKKIPGIVPITPHESKYARATAVSPFVRAGNVHLPEGVEATVRETDAEALIDEAAAFPNAAHDDTVDALSQALAHVFLDGGGEAWLDWMRKQLEKARGGAPDTEISEWDTETPESDTPAPESVTPAVDPVTARQLARDAAHRERSRY